ncbi:Ryncolin-4 [Holothuria leucospilota]|uniref:Ryncolin-4 n=1 Tax=Holothuria leucospilota TaxID=206669 RepID=A0A9Q0YNQ0_HOLLE|nr:Ryncolin-4 [Holothuria leucospilota]
MSPCIQFSLQRIIFFWTACRCLLAQQTEPSYFFYQQAQYPRDCNEIRDLCGSQSSAGVYLIKPNGYPTPFEIFCDNGGDSEGWTVIHRRLDGSLNFNRSWLEYKSGFGFLSNEFWIGNEKLSLITNQKKYELRIDFSYLDGSSYHATYKEFRITDEFSNYALTTLNDYSGTANFTDCPSNLERDECNCIVEGNSIPDGGVYVAPDCSRRCNCTVGQLTCDDNDGVTCVPSDCLDVYNSGETENGIYDIKPIDWEGSPFQVYCNMSDGGGWTVFQRRVDGSTDFHLYWNDYKVGFGVLGDEHWLGNDKIYSLTNQRRYEIRVDLVHTYGIPYYAKFDFFRINDETNNYRLSVGNYYEGDAGDSLHTYHNNQDFSTRDRDNDDVSYNIAYNTYNGAWWWGGSDYSIHSKLNARNHIYWATQPNAYDYNKFTEMKIRPVSV